MVWSSGITGGSPYRCCFVWWSNWRRMSSIAPITITLLVLWTFPQEMNILDTLKTTSGSITTNTQVVSTRLSVGRRITTPLHHATLVIGRFSFEILAIVLTFIHRCRWTSRWQSRSLLFMLEGWPVFITLMLSGLVPCLSSFVLELLFIPQLLFLNLLYIDH